MKTNKYWITSLFIIMTFDSIFAQDWAALNHFKQANERLHSEIENKDRVVFMGNSITIGWIQLRPDFFEGKPFVNRGISGQTTAQMLLRFRQDVVDLNPKLVVILAGTNDIAGNTGDVTVEQIMDNLKSMSEIATANKIEVLLCSVLPASDYSWRPDKNPDKKIPELNNLIEQYASSHGHHYLDYFTSLRNQENGMKTEYADDGVHPTTEGYQVMEGLLEEKLLEIL